MVPFPAYPWLHVQLKLPGVLVHVALESQSLVALAHSSMSVQNKSDGADVIAAPLAPLIIVYGL